MLSVGGVWQACDHMYQVQTLAICHHWPQTCPAVPEEGTVTTFYIGCISSKATVLCCPEKVRDTDHCEQDSSVKQLTMLQMIPLTLLLVSSTMATLDQEQRLLKEVTAGSSEDKTGKAITYKSAGQYICLMAICQSNIQFMSNFSFKMVSDAQLIWKSAQIKMFSYEIKSDDYLLRLFSSLIFRFQWFRMKNFD